MRGNLPDDKLFSRLKPVPQMLKLDHLTVIAPTLEEGVAHVKCCLDIDVPYGARHLYMGTHNHRLQLGSSVYLEIVALDPEGASPGRSRWFGLDDQERIRSDWDEGRRLRGWVASTTNIDKEIADHQELFGQKVSLPLDDPRFDFTIPTDGSLPRDGAVPSLIDLRGKQRTMANIPDLGARLVSFVLEHPQPGECAALYNRLAIDRPPEIVAGLKVRYRALIETAHGPRELT